MEAVHADWKEYLNLLICEENHLKHMDEYHKVRHRGHTRTHTGTHVGEAWVSDWVVCVCVQYHKEARDTQDLQKRLETEVNQKYNPEFKDVYQMEGLIQDLDVSLSPQHGGLMTSPSMPENVYMVCICVCVCVGPSQSHGQLRRAGEGSPEAQPAGAASQVSQGHAPEAAACGSSV